jgi:SOS response regulatory protein OraA/RecX
MVSELHVESTDELQRALKEMGYSDDVINEILKWYKYDSANGRA